MLLGYCRVSTQDQAAEDRSSLEQQENIIRGFAMAKGFAKFDTAVYSDPGVSGGIPLRERPAGKRLLDDVKPGDTVIAAKLDRMFRSSRDALMMSEIFKEKNIDLVLFNLGSEPVNRSGIAEFFFTIMSAAAQFERVVIRERTLAGKEAKIAKGGHAGGCAPYGYRIIGKRRDARLEPVETEQYVLAKVRSWLTECAEISIAETCRRLAEEGAASRNGKPFFKMQVSRIMEQARKKPSPIAQQ